MQENLFNIIISLATGFILVILSVPKILKVARAKNLFESENERKIHTGKIPTLGGVAIFIGFILSIIIATDGYIFNELKYIIAGVIIMFFIGIKDDLITISARKKLIVQIFTAVLLINLGDIKFTNLHGILGFYDIHYTTELLITVFTIVVIVNAFNLIDGIDGLASGLGILASLVFGTWFYLAGFIQYSILSFALAGSLSGFFLFNVFGHRNKLFMGDTGSLIIGLIVSIQVIKFNEFNIYNYLPYSLNAAPSLSFAIILVPLVDTLRVMTIRILSGRSPFSPDKNHIHHRILGLVPNHLKVTLIMVTGNALCIGLAFLLNYFDLESNLQLLLIISFGIFLSFVPSILLRYNEKKKRVFVLANSIS